MQRKVGSSVAILLCLTAVAQAIPTVVVGDHSQLLNNTAGQLIQLEVSGITPNTVNGISLGVAINNGGPGFGGLLGPTITAFDWASGPTIWEEPWTPAGFFRQHADYFDPGGQLAQSVIITVSGFTNQSGGLLVNLIVDTTGIGPGVYSLDLFGGTIADVVGNTTFTGLGNPDPGQSLFNGTITLLPEPSSVVLGLSAIAGFGVVVFRKCRARQAIGLAAWGLAEEKGTSLGRKPGQV